MLVLAAVCVARAESRNYCAARWPGETGGPACCSHCGGGGAALPSAHARALFTAQQPLAQDWLPVEGVPEIVLGMEGTPLRRAARAQ